MFCVGLSKDDALIVTEQKAKKGAHGFREKLST